ncbi:MAG: diadenylate cyclase CdaA [Verrucomicrobiota bacterium]|nr:diadenylate cyclase CdaA [Verrucomicrobiota bacterium]
MWAGISSLGINEVVQVVILWLAYYHIFLFFRGTRGAQALVGLSALILVLIALTQLFNLDALAWILNRFWVVLGFALLVIFQPEIRNALAELGKGRVFALGADNRTAIDNVIQAVEYLAEHKIGALIAIEREVETKAVQETGIHLGAPLIPELLSSIFFPHTPLHDGGAIVNGNRIVAAGCVFPLSQSMDLQKTLGTRHRAAVGLSEESDAAVVVVSEETGSISVCYRGRLSQGIDGGRLKRFLSALHKQSLSRSVWRRVQSRLDLTPAGIAESEQQTAKENDRGGQGS